MSELVSVIVNVYNCKEYLPYSLESIRQQTYKNLEVILVDDASTDGSSEFCDEFCKQDERFRVLHHAQNTGVSGPRNTGLKNAHGEYIYFLDGDDYIHVEMIERLYNAIQETGIELAVCNLYVTSSLVEDNHCLIENKELEIIPIERIVFEMLSGAKLSLRWCVVWNKLYKKSLIEGLFFNDYYSIQDQDFNIQVYQRIENLAFVPEPLYWYFNNPNSLQRDPSYNAKRYYLNTLNRFKMLDYLSKNDELWEKYRAWVIGYGCLQMLDRRKIEKGTKYEVDFNKLCKEIIKKTRWEFITMKNFQPRKKIKFVFAWYFPCLYGYYKKIKVRLHS